MFKTQNSVLQPQLLVDFFKNAHFKLKTQFSNNLYKPNFSIKIFQENPIQIPMNVCTHNNNKNS